MIRSECCICGNPVRPDYWACVPCRRQHNLPDKFADWPDWATTLANAEQERRRYEEEWADRMRYSIELADEGMRGVPDDTLAPFASVHTRPGVTSDGLPYSPYSTEAENRVYRQANNIPERD